MYSNEKIRREYTVKCLRIVNSNKNYRGFVDNTLKICGRNYGVYFTII